MVLNQTDGTKIEEEKHLSETVAKVIKANEDLKNRLEVIGKDNLELLADLRKDPETGTNFEMFLDQLSEKNRSYNFKDKYAQLEELEYLTSNPYFARIDVKNHKDENLQSIYIGKFGYSERSPVITDWRASIASIYYRYRFPQKNVEYKTDAGSESSDLSLKRTFDIYKGSLVKYYNNDIQLDENEVIIDKIHTRTGGVLEDIVETIQKDQMDIIESDPRQVCIVQGCVGSGKSTVAIHKLAHIFFHFANYIHPQRSILVVKSQILVGYLATLFPKLGIFDINFKTLRDLVVNALFREELGLAVDLDKDQNTGNFGNSEIKQLLKSIDEIHVLYQEKIKKIFEEPDFESYGGFKYSKLLTPYENLSEIIDDLNEEVESQAEYLKENPKSIRALIFKHNIRTLRSLIRKVNDLRYQLKDKIMQQVLEGQHVDLRDKLSYISTLIYILVYSRLIGFKKFQPYEYCVIDESQDFSLLEFAVLNCFVLRGRFGIFGDLNQGLTADGIKDWKDINTVIPETATAKIYSLETNYRSTKPIITLANSILSKYTKDYLPKSLDRDGPKPQIDIGDSFVDIKNKFLEMFELDFKNLSKSIGIIFYDKEADSLINPEIMKLTKNQAIKLDQSKKITYIPNGVYTMSVDDCKGLEFSKVYILGLNLNKVYNKEDARKAFVAVTRAMNEVVVMGIK